MSASAIRRAAITSRQSNSTKRPHAPPPHMHGSVVFARWR